MASEGTILSDAMRLIKSQEGLRLKAYWDVSRWSIGYGSLSFEGEQITQKEADDRLFDYVKKEYAELIKWIPKFTGDQIAVPLLSKAYQYGSGVFKHWAPLAKDIPNMLYELFVKDEDYPLRREAELKFYNDLLKENPLSNIGIRTVVMGLIGLITAIAIYVAYNRNGTK